MKIIFLITFLSLLSLSCSKLEYQNICEDKNGTYNEESDYCTCNEQRFNPYTNQDCEVVEYEEY